MKLILIIAYYENNQIEDKNKTSAKLHPDEERFYQNVLDPYQLENTVYKVERSRDEDLYDLVQNSLNQDANLNQSYDFDIGPPEEAGNALDQKDNIINNEDQKQTVNFSKNTQI